MTTTRIYRVADGDTVRLVDAATPSQAIRHCAEQHYRVSVATPWNIAELVGKGVKVEIAAPKQLAIAGTAE